MNNTARKNIRVVSDQSIKKRSRYVEDFSYKDRMDILKAYMDGDATMPELGVIYDTSSGTIACLLHAQAMLEGKYDQLLHYIVTERYNSGRNRKNKEEVK